MDTERAEGIVLRRQPVTESSLLVTWYTREFGKLKTMAKGARRTKGPFQGKIDLFYRDEIVFLPSKRSDLHLLHDCYLEDAHPSLRDSVKSLTAASYACELVELATEQEDPNAAVYDLLRTILHVFEARLDDTLLIWFEIRLMAMAGWKAVWETNTGTGRMLQSLANSSLEGIARVKLSKEQLDDVRRVVWQFWDVHLDRPLKTRVFVGGKVHS
ncbi:MAG TPA: DNA repair protein RecO [Verrucomicrobiae bacterium]|nr:DNA repair protein RecO [Verrucomicrobiae bacterium]